MDLAARSLHISYFQLRVSCVFLSGSRFFALRFSRALSNPKLFHGEIPYLANISGHLTVPFKSSTLHRNSLQRRMSQRMRGRFSISLQRDDCPAHTAAFLSICVIRLTQMTLHVSFHYRNQLTFPSCLCRRTWIYIVLMFACEFTHN
ncbi:hypothetical protein T03_12250 [Trichinella britovi]|uniref:Uncharacterized protein n=1 Tax=Trichinella britovi TaxID=45882 RepID=A0A0V1C510_TRIBR|nr:hypothetical protein T03_12250 [Trichinella britovi]